MGRRRIRPQQHVDAHVDTLDKLATAVAIFGRDQKLTFHNRAFTKLWGLPEGWLERHPSDGEILDRLREGRKLPEQERPSARKATGLAASTRPPVTAPPRNIGICLAARPCGW